MLLFHRTIKNLGDIKQYIFKKGTFFNLQKVPFCYFRKYVTSKRAVFNRIFHRKKRPHFMDKKGTLLILTKKVPFFTPNHVLKSWRDSYIYIYIYIYATTLWSSFLWKYNIIWYAYTQILCIYAMYLYI